MTIRPKPLLRFSRRAAAAISVIVRLGVSSTNSGAWLSSAAFSTSLRRSSLEIVPLRSRWPLTSAIEQSMRSASSIDDISRLTNSVDCWAFIDTCSAMFSASAVLPMLGRAARMINSESCRPPVNDVEIGEAGFDAADGVLVLHPGVDPIQRLLQDAARYPPPCRLPRLSRMAKIFCSARASISRGSSDPS